MRDDPAATHRARVASGETNELVRAQTLAQSRAGAAVTRADVLSDGDPRVELQRPPGGGLPDVAAGGLLDVVIAPKYLRHIHVRRSVRRRVTSLPSARESGARGSALMHRIFSQPTRFSRASE